jgi:hypothetical protein
VAAACAIRACDFLQPISPTSSPHTDQLPSHQPGLAFPTPLLCTCRRFRDSGFYIGHTPEENTAAGDERFGALAQDAGFKEAVLDLTAEDAGEGRELTLETGVPQGSLAAIGAKPKLVAYLAAWSCEAQAARLLSCLSGIRPSIAPDCLACFPLPPRRGHAGPEARAVSLGQALQEVRQAGGQRDGQGRQARQDGVGLKGGRPVGWWVVGAGGWVARAR